MCRAISIRRARGSVGSHGGPLDTLEALWPVRRADASLKDLLLLDEVFLGSCTGRGVAGVDGHTNVVALGLDVVVGDSAVPDDEITRAEIDLLKLVATLSEPCQAGFLVAVPSVGELISKSSYSQTRKTKRTHWSTARASLHCGRYRGTLARSCEHLALRQDHHHQGRSRPS
jgi:hypothetical protein